MLLMMWVESSRCFPVRIPSAWMIRSVVSWKASRPPSCCIRRTRKLCSVFLGEVGLLHIQPQGVVPEQIELQLF